MKSPGQFNRKVRFRRRGLDGDGVRTGPYADVVTRRAAIDALIGGEAVQAQRLEGRQPVIITVWADGLTKAIDNSYRAIDAFDASISWDVTSKIVTDDVPAQVEIQVVERKGGSDDGQA